MTNPDCKIKEEFFTHLPDLEATFNNMIALREAAIVLLQEASKTASDLLELDKNFAPENDDKGLRNGSFSVLDSFVIKRDFNIGTINDMHDLHNRVKYWFPFSPEVKLKAER